MVSKIKYSEIEKEEYRRKLDNWAKRYPFAAIMMFSNMTMKDKIKYAKTLY